MEKLPKHIEAQLGRRWRHVSKAQRRAWSSLGGRTAHAEGRAHQWTSEEARAAGKLGAAARAAKRRQQKEQP